MQLFGKTEQVKFELVGKIDRLTERECRELAALLQLPVDGIQQNEQGVEVIGLSDVL